MTGAICRRARPAARPRGRVPGRRADDDHVRAEGGDRSGVRGAGRSPARSRSALPRTRRARHPGRATERRPRRRWPQDDARRQQGTEVPVASTNVRRKTPASLTSPVRAEVCPALRRGSAGVGMVRSVCGGASSCATLVRSATSSHARSSKWTDTYWRGGGSDGMAVQRFRPRLLRPRARWRSGADPAYDRLVRLWLPIPPSGGHHARGGPCGRSWRRRPVSPRWKGATKSAPTSITAGSARSSSRPSGLRHVRKVRRVGDPPDGGIGSQRRSQAVVRGIRASAAAHAAERPGTEPLHRHSIRSRRRASTCPSTYSIKRAMTLAPNKRCARRRAAAYAPEETPADPRPQSRTNLRLHRARQRSRVGGGGPGRDRRVGPLLGAVRRLVATDHEVAALLLGLGERRGGESEPWTGSSRWSPAPAPAGPQVAAPAGRDHRRGDERVPDLADERLVVTLRRIAPVIAVDLARPGGAVRPCSAPATDIRQAPLDRGCGAVPPGCVGYPPARAPTHDTIASLAGGPRTADRASVDDDRALPQGVHSAGVAGSGPGQQGGGAATDRSPASTRSAGWPPSTAAPAARTRP